jgi:hypothetical protein
VQCFANTAKKNLKREDDEPIHITITNLIHIVLSDIDIQNLDEQIKSKIAEVLYELKEKYARQQGTFFGEKHKIDINNYQYDDEDFDGLEQEYMENRPKSSKQGFKAYDRGVCIIFSDQNIAC